MAESKHSIFNQRAAEKLRSPDDLDKYVRVTNPSVWVVLAACLTLLAGLLAWGIFGSVTTSVTTTGAVVDISKLSKETGLGDPDTTKVAVCFLSAEDVAKVDVGDPANVDGEQMTVGFIAPIPDAPDEWDSAIGSQYLVKALFSGDWAYPVAFKGDTSELTENTPLTVVITTERISPISLILKNWG